MDVLVHIKQLLVRRRYRFSVKAFEELEMDGLEMVEKLYVIESFNYRGTLLYTKGKFAREAGEEIYYCFISSKRSRYGP